MRRVKPSRQRAVRRAAFAALGVPLIAFGCTGTGDLISSRRFRDDPYKTMFTKEDPVAVLTRESSDGDQRIDAMHRLKEPMALGSTPAEQEMFLKAVDDTPEARPIRTVLEREQDAVLKLLTDIATSDPQGLCRVAAVEALGRFRDPRAAAALVQAYQNAPINTLAATSIIVQASYNPATPGAKDASNFSLDLIARIQSQTMESLGQSRSAAGKKLLIETASKSNRKPQAATPELEALSAYDAEHYRFDIRLAAINALRHFEGDAEVTRALIGVLQAERDTAVQNRCMVALAAVTKEKHGNDPQAWITAHGGTPTPPPLGEAVKGAFVKDEASKR